MKIKVDCKFLSEKFVEDVCLAHSKGKEVEKCKGECEDCKKKGGVIMKYKVGDKVKIKSLDWYNKNKDKDGDVDCGMQNFVDSMKSYCGQILTIKEIGTNYSYSMLGNVFWWTDEMIEGLAEEENKDMGDVSDGYHTFNELYEYRLLYNASMFNELAKQGLYDVHKSKRHSDGEVPFGDSNWFIVMAELPTGQISNHYEMRDWDLFQIPEKEKANVWDGHTPKDVAERIRRFLTPKPKYPATYEKCDIGSLTTE